MTITISILKQMAKEVYIHVKPLLSTKEGAQMLNEGAGGDISMKIDVVAERTVIEFLKNNNANLLLISEEIGELIIGDENKAKKSRKKIIIDPIDGSTNSVRGIPFSCISIAYAEGDTLKDIKMGVVLDLNTSDIYWAEKGNGAFMNDEKITVSPIGSKDQILFEVDFDLDYIVESFSQVKSLLDKIYRIRVMGSIAMSCCLLAKGALDGMIDLRKGTRIIDIAAGSLILKEAGGRIFSKSGDNLYDITLSIDAKIPFVASNANLEEFIKEELKKIYN
ncbi:MAG: inositol monophosphatase family protein [Promethearchaeota archaeon]